jgi:acetylornithine/succinyldiaminopimelate/putrescine aminotransferase
MDQDSLVERVASVGQAVAPKVQDAASGNSRITSVNAAGTMMWINTANAKDAFDLRDHLRREGVLVKLNGAQGVVCKPSLTLEEQHTQPLVSAVKKF